MQNIFRPTSEAKGRRSRATGGGGDTFDSSKPDTRGSKARPSRRQAKRTPQGDEHRRHRNRKATVKIKIKGEQKSKQPISECYVR